MQYFSKPLFTHNKTAHRSMLYAADGMPTELVKAHNELDKAVDSAYGYKPVLSKVEGGKKDEAARWPFCFNAISNSPRHCWKQQPLKKTGRLNINKMIPFVMSLSHTVRPEFIEGCSWFDRLTTNAIILLCVSYINDGILTTQKNIPSCLS